MLLCVPLKLRRAIFEEMHDSPMSGHLGWIGTYARMRHRFFWKNIESNTREYVRKCVSCQEHKPDKGPKKGNMQASKIPKLPFEKVALDLFGQFTTTPKRLKYIIV